jgi:hypothetical protein
VTYIFEADGIPYLFFKHDAKSGLLPAKEARKSPLKEGVSADVVRQQLIQFMDTPILKARWTQRPLMFRKNPRKWSLAGLSKSRNTLAIILQICVFTLASKTFHHL